MSSFGFYILANDKVFDHCRALINSIELHSSEIQICIIPYDENYKKIEESFPNVFIYPDLDFVLELQERSDKLFRFEGVPESVCAPRNTHKRNRLRNLACFWGPFESFAYLDSDIVVLTNLHDLLRDPLRTNDFVVCDRQHNNGFKWVFSQEIKKVFDKKQIRTFNGGFWASRKNLLSKEEAFSLLDDCSKNPQYFDYQSGVIVQPIINYLIHKTVDISKRANLLDIYRSLSEPWAGVRDYTQIGTSLVKDGRICPFLHWAGKPVGEEGSPYLKLWEYYRGL